MLGDEVFGVGLAFVDFFGGGVPFFGAVGAVLILEEFEVFFGLFLEFAGDDHGCAGEELGVGPDGLFGGIDGADAADEEAAGEEAVDGEEEDDAAGALADEEVAEPGDDPGEDECEVAGGAGGLGGGM